MRAHWSATGSAAGSAISYQLITNIVDHDLILDNHCNYPVCKRSSRCDLQLAKVHT